MRKTGLFTHVRGNLRDDVSGKRFSTHVGEGNVERIGEGRCGNDKGMESESGEDGECVGVRCAIAQGGSCEVGTQGTTRVSAREAPSRVSATWALSRSTRHRVPSQGTGTGYRHRTLPQLNITVAYKQRHPG